MNDLFFVSMGGIDSVLDLQGRDKVFPPSGARPEVE
jgi:hypothetical protein